MTERLIKILLIEDNPDDVQRIQTWLQERSPPRYQVVHGERLATGLRQLEQERFDLLLLDLDLPDSRGFETFFRVRTEGPDLPVILLADRDEADFSLRAVREGVQDYLVKGEFGRALLTRAITYGLERYHLRQELIRQTSALLYSEARFHHMIEHHLDSIVIVDGAGRICFANPAAESLFGRPADQLIGRPFDFPVDAGVSTEIEIASKTGTGPTALVEMQVAETSWEGEPAYLTSLRDITDRKRMEEALRRSQSEWQSTFNAMSDWVCLLDIETSRIIRSNRVGESFTGLPARELVGQIPRQYLHGSEKPLAQCPVQQVIQTGRPESTEFYVPHQKSWYMVTAEPVFDQQGELVSAVHITRDITARKQAELKLKEYSEGLEQMVAARTRELEDRLAELKALQAQLVRQEKLAVLGQMAGGVAHDLRNPIGVIKNGLYYLKAVLPEREAKVQEALAMAQQGVSTAEEFINSLLDFAGGRPPQRQAVALNRLLQTTLSSLPLSRPGIEVGWQLERVLPPVWADPRQLERVFGNLLLNAVQAMPASLQEKGVRRLTIKSERPAPRWVAVSITDTGVGIPPEDRAKLFEPLFTRKGSGVGLGLALVKSLVDRHGGAVEVESEVGQGSTFTVKLPVDDNLTGGDNQQ